MNTEVQKGLAALRRAFVKHGECAEAIVSAAGGNLYALDLVMLAALKRSLSLTRGFCDLMESGNFVCAAALIRLQLDNVLRAAAPGWAEDQDALSVGVLRGKRISQFKGRDGEPLTDRKLVDRRAATDPWVSDVYRETSGFVHLSWKHIFSAFKRLDEEDRVANLVIGERDDFVPSSARLEAVRAYLQITQLLLGVMVKYAEEKCGRVHADEPPA